MMVDAVAVYLEKMAQSRPREVQVSYEEMQIMLRFYACGMVGVLLQYVDKPNLNEEKLVIQMERIITGKMFPGKHNSI